ncbi:MAG: hypothetical protein MJ184_04420 [Treponema sp.]|uniref:hypothetical protein n=1 Tax=Treponema sp. TaxID=166 RepID=UPI00298E75D4|nr:hypothetical protein [Treponema sp.]MCQ2600586.1 hypothetical protein [Treponema sp.]
MICWKCNQEINVEIFRTTECPLCHAQLHVCKGCKFYAPGNHYDCKETVDEIVSDKEHSNFCDSFSYGINSPKASSSDKAKAAKDAFNALFGD